MPIISVVGVSHHTCPIEVREQFALTEAQPCARIDSDGRASEAVWLSTCNRTERYSVVEDGADAEAAFAEALDVPAGIARRYSYALEEAEAARHLFRVAGGLDSAVVGEDEILGQVRRAFADARERGAAGPMLTRLFQDALAAGKRVRAETEIGRCPVSVSGAAASILLARWGWESLENASVLVIGAGELARGVARRLAGMRARDLTIANRTHARARDLARETGADALRWPLAPELLAQFDAIVSCTSAPGFVLSREAVEAAARSLPEGRSLHLIDLAVPRDIDPEAASVAGVHLNNIDDARTIVDDSLSKRSQHVAPAERIVEEQLAGFREWLTSRNVSDSIRLLKERADEIRQGELEWALPKLAGLSPDERAVVEQFSTRLVNKLLHTPTQRLRETAGDGGADCLGEYILQVFDLDSDSDTASAGETAARPEPLPLEEGRPAHGG